MHSSTSCLADRQALRMTRSLLFEQTSTVEYLYFQAVNFKQLHKTATKQIADIGKEYLFLPFTWFIEYCRLK